MAIHAVIVQLTNGIFGIKPVLAYGECFMVDFGIELESAGALLHAWEKMLWAQEKGHQ